MLGIVTIVISKPLSEGCRLVSTSPTRFSNLMGSAIICEPTPNPIEPISCPFLSFFFPFSLFFLFLFLLPPPLPSSDLQSRKNICKNHVAPRDGESLRTLLPQPRKPLCPCLPRIFGCDVFFKIGGPARGKGSDGRQCGR